MIISNKGKTYAQVQAEIWAKANPKAAAKNKADAIAASQKAEEVIPEPIPAEDNYLQVGEPVSEITPDEEPSIIVELSADELTRKQFENEGKSPEEIEVLMKQFEEPLPVEEPTIPQDEISAIIEQSPVISPDVDAKEEIKYEGGSDSPAQQQMFPE